MAVVEGVLRKRRSNRFPAERRLRDAPFSERLAQDVRLFWRRTKAEGDCLIWQGGVCGGTYGGFYSGAFEATVSAHKFAWIVTSGDVPEGLMVCHTCDNHLCVKPDHLFLGTQMENIADMIAKGRARFRQKGELRRCKLDIEQVRTIRTESDGTWASVSAFAKSFGVLPRAAYNAFWRKTWKHVD